MSAHVQEVHAIDKKSEVVRENCVTVVSTENVIDRWRSNTGRICSVHIGINFFGNAMNLFFHSYRLNSNVVLGVNQCTKTTTLNFKFWRLKWKR